MKGKFIVCEGLDAAGKTTVIKEALKKLDKGYEYSKGLTSDTFMGRIAPKIPSTLAFMIELAYNTRKNVKPALKSGGNILQDRYDLSVSSYIPYSERWYNKCIVKIFKRFLFKPDVLVYFTVSGKERVERLKSQPYNRHHDELIKNPLIIKLRERKYLELYEKFDGKKFKINTTNRSIDSVVEEFMLNINLP